MQSSTIFTERQTFLKNWWALLLPLLCVLLAVPVSLYYTNKPHHLQFPWVVGLVVFVAVGLLVTLRLDTRLTATGVSYRLFPLHLTWQHIDWSVVAQAYVRSYDPLSEYGGWGLKGTNANRAYNMAGDTGLQLVLQDGKRVLMGTQHSTEIQQFLATIAVADQPA